ncbi:MAG: lipocalin-like domain-containing protein [Alphaproteobacteria bacterium]|nr:lipocalin-like domain-containing protein [Alphaproteobacteria bacterium]
MGRESSLSDQAKFIGAWRLVSIERRAADGEVDYPYGPAPKGYIIWTADSHMAVVLTHGERPPFKSSEARAGTDREKAMAFDGLFTYAGPYHVADGAVHHRIEHCHFPNLQSQTQTRFYTFEGKRVILKSAPTPAAGKDRVTTITWERSG